MGQGQAAGTTYHGLSRRQKVVPLENSGLGQDGTDRTGISILNQIVIY